MTTYSLEDLMSLVLRGAVHESARGIDRYVYPDESYVVYGIGEVAYFMACLYGFDLPAMVKRIDDGRPGSHFNYFIGQYESDAVSPLVAHSITLVTRDAVGGATHVVYLVALGFDGAKVFKHFKTLYAHLIDPKDSGGYLVSTEA